MTRLSRIFSVFAATLLLAACATTERLAAAGDVHALLVSIRENDRDAFEAHIDRRALERQLEARLQAQADRADVGDDWKALGGLLAGPLSRVAGEALIRPEVFRTVAESYGYGPDKPIPNTFAVAGLLRSLPDGRVCAPRKKHGPCLLTFADEGGTWRLVSFEGDASMLRRKGG
ncbi:MAG TPA: DUF2939 domain-containing protein [Caulobacteraceae bacterium]|jgi:hypothetical protein|nr:DUF2939 domain-containing protein [Caulobacteraceae bacterium]